jgi:hypothetical protein
MSWQVSLSLFVRPASFEALSWQLIMRLVITDGIMAWCPVQIQHMSSSLDETRIEFATAGLQLRLTEAAYLQLPRQREEVPDYQRHASAPGPRVPLVQKALTIRTRKRSGSIVATTRLGTAAIDFNATADVRLVIAIPSEATTKVLSSALDSCTQVSF